MRKAALVLGIIWLAALAAIGTALLISGHFPNVRGLMYALIGAAIPGALLYRHGRGPFPRQASTRELLTAAYPPKTAREMGHVMRINGDRQLWPD